MEKQDMTDFIVKYLKEADEPWLTDDIDDAFPKPPTVMQWLELIEELERSGRLLKHPNGRHFLPDEPKPSRVTNISGEQVIYSEGDNFGDQSVSSITKNITTDTKADNNTMRNLIVSIIGGLVVGLILFYAFGIGG